MHGRVVRKKYENHAKSIKLNTTEAGKSLREFHQATRDYRLRKDNSTKEREKELYSGGMLFAFKLRETGFYNKRRTKHLIFCNSRMRKIRRANGVKRRVA